MTTTRDFIILEKAVGQTPLQCMEAWRTTQPDLTDTPLAYAGRLDPMASGKLLVLIGDACKRQTDYHGLDKEYEVEVLLGVESDSGDVLGLLTEQVPTNFNTTIVASALTNFQGEVAWPYPIYSSKPVNGKPLHTWAVEGRLDEIEIPTHTGVVHDIELLQIETKTRTQIADESLTKIETIPPVTELRKAIGNDFRRPDIRVSWNTFKKSGQPDDQFQIVTLRCHCGSGVYMRTLAEELGKTLNTTGLAYHIHRTRIGDFEQD